MLITWATSAIIPMILRVNLTILPVAIKWASVAGVGLVAGLATRWLLSQNTLTLKLVSAFLALSSGLWLTGYLTMGEVGFRLFHLSDVAVDWIGLIQLSLGCIAAMLPLFAWRISPVIQLEPRQSSSQRSRSTKLSTPKRTTHKKTKSSKPSRIRKSTRLDRRTQVSKKRISARSSVKRPTTAKRSVQVVPRRSQSSGRNLRGVLRNLENAQRNFWKKTGAALNSGAQSLQMAGNAMRLNLRSAGKAAQIRLRDSGRAIQRRLQSRKSTARARLHNPGASTAGFQSRQIDARLRANHSSRDADSPVHLVGETEHRCPYCLDKVIKNDRRGVVVCPICHTHHHADCWAITGTCQVPHQFE